jgi:hypothetical protein
LGAGIVFVLPRGFQTFLNVWTFQGNKLYDARGASLGLRVDL